MCNRYRLKAKLNELIEHFDLLRELHWDSDSVVVEYYPGKAVPVVRVAGDHRRLEVMTWGFAPFKGKRPINNTRSENAPTSAFWNRHLNHRCVFPLSEAIEWQHQVNTATGELRKVPHVIRFRDDRVAAVAGIYHHAASGAGSCSMMTCRANRFWSSIHNANPDDPRMVCFLLDRASMSAWLDPGLSFEQVRDLLRPVPDQSDLLIAKPMPAKGD